MAETEDRLITSAEAARILQVKIRTVQRWADRGVLTAIRPYPLAQRRFRESQVRNLLESKDN